MGTGRRLLDYVLGFILYIDIMCKYSLLFFFFFSFYKFYKINLITCSSKVYSKRAPGQELMRDVSVTEGGGRTIKAFVCTPTTDKYGLN